MCGLENISMDSKLCVQLQGYVVCPSEKRFLLLFTFLRKNRNKKVMVFFSSCLEVKYFHELLNYIDIPVTCIHVSISCLFRFSYFGFLIMMQFWTVMTCFTTWHILWPCAITVLFSLCSVTRVIYVKNSYVCIACLMHRGSVILAVRQYGWLS